VPGYPEALADIVAKAMQVDPEARYASAAALGDAVVAFARQADVSLGSDAVAAVMLREFGPPPPVVEPAELELADTATIPQLHAQAPAPTRRAWLPYAAVPLALLVGALGMRWLGGDTEPPSQQVEVQPSASPSTQAEPELAEVAQVEPPEPEAEPPESEAKPPEPAATPEPEAKPPEPVATPEPKPRRKRPRKRKRAKAKEAPKDEPDTNTLRDVLYPPGS
jgi:outer membrane biosynthesis protein TonB